MIRAVLFDADGVIQEPSAAWRPALLALAGDNARAEELLADIFAAEKPCLTGVQDFETALAEVLLRRNCATNVAEALQIWTMIERDNHSKKTAGLNGYLVCCMNTTWLQLPRRIDLDLISDQLGHRTRRDKVP